jgi:DNA (cytosine-5)-methyltransferase 1
MGGLRLLDLFCGAGGCAGGCAVGYHRAGFAEVVGVDIAPQPNYPFTFVLGDALEYVSKHGHTFDMIHASPPCQAYSITCHIHGKSKSYPDLIGATRAALRATGKPYVIENVPGSPLVNPVKLRGDMFGLRVLRERWFETNPWLLSPPMPPRPKDAYTNVSRGYSSFSAGATYICVAGHNFSRADGAKAMAIDWMQARDELAQAIPPAYTEYIGKQMIRVIAE